MVKQPRDKICAAMMMSKKAIMETKGDLDNAIVDLQQTGTAKAEKKGERTAKEGLVFSYIHHGGRLGVLVELNCETDFVAKTEGFTDLAHNLAMQIAATNPLSIKRDDIDQLLLKREKAIFSDQAKESGKPENIIETMVDGRMYKFFQEICLMEQAYIKDSEKKILDILTESIATLGENITISRYTRFAVGESDSSNGQI